MKIRKCQKCKFDWTRIAMSLKSPTFSRRFRTLLPLLGGPILYGLFGFLGYTNLLEQSKQHLNLKIILILDHGSQTSTHCFFKNGPFFQKIFFGYIFWQGNHRPAMQYKQNANYPSVKINWLEVPDIRRCNRKSSGRNFMR